MEAVKADAGLQEKLKAAADSDEVVAIAKEAGFILTADELERSQAEISEEVLEGVNGGAERGIPDGQQPFYSPCVRQPFKPFK